MFILSLIFALIVTGCGVHGTAISSRSGNVTAIVGYPLTISWTHSFLDSDIDLCYYQSKKKYLDEFVGWSNKNRERLNITDNHRGWDFINEKMPCQDGIRREDAGIHDTGEYKIYVQTTDGQRHEGQWIEVTVVSGSELFYTLTINDTDITKNIAHQSALPTLQMEDHGLTSLSISLGKGFPRSNVTLSVHFENSSHVETLQSCPMSVSCSGNFTAKTDLVQISVDIESGIQGFEHVRVQQPVLVIDHQTPIVATNAAHYIVGLVVAVVLLVVFLLLLIILLICLCNKRARRLKKVRKYLLRKHDDTALKAERENLRSDVETLTTEKYSLQIANRSLDEKNKELDEENGGLKKERAALLDDLKKKSVECQNLAVEKSNLQDKLYAKERELTRTKQQAEADKDLMRKQHEDDVNKLQARITELERQPKKPGGAVRQESGDAGGELEFVDTYEDQVLTKCQELKLSVTFSLKPKMVSWFRDRVLLDDGIGTGVRLRNENNTYSIKIKPGDVKPGIYQCQAQDRWNNVVTHNAKVTIEPGDTSGELTFTDMYEDQVLTKRQELNLRATFSVKPKMVSWFRDRDLLDDGIGRGVKLKNENNTYFIRIKPGDVKPGIYQCQARDRWNNVVIHRATVTIGESKETDNLKENSPPGFTDTGDLIDKFLQSNEPLKLSVGVSGSPTPAVTWYRNTRPLRPFQGRIDIIQSEGTAMLTVTPSTFYGVTGEYYCAAVNDFGHAMSPAIMVQVGEPAEEATENSPPAFTDTSDLTDKFLGRKVPLILSVGVSGSPQPDVIWYRDTKRLKHTPGLYDISQSDKRASLRVTPPSFGDVVGQYYCEAVNDYGDAKSQEIMVQVGKLTTPIFKDRFRDKTVREGNRAFFQAKVEGYPPPEFEWFKDSVRMSNTDRVKIAERKVSSEYVTTLTIEPFSAEDAGQIKLAVSNDEGSEECSANLSVSAPANRPPSTSGRPFSQTWDPY